MIDRKTIQLGQFDKALNQIKETKVFQDYLANEGINEEKASQQLYQEIKKGCCQGVSFELLAQLAAHYSLSCSDLLNKVNVERSICNQVSFCLKDDELIRSKIPRIIGGNFVFDSFPSSVPASFYQGIVEESLKNVDFNEVIAGEVRLMSMDDDKNGHVITFQYSDEFYRYYDAEKGFYSYPSKTSFFAHLRSSILGNYSRVCSNGYGLNVQIIVYAINKKPSSSDSKNVDAVSFPSINNV